MRTLSAILVAATAASVAAAQGVIMEKNISFELARTIANAAMECIPNGNGLSVAVVDRACVKRVDSTVESVVGLRHSTSERGDT